MAGLDKFINQYLRSLDITSPYSAKNSKHLTDLAGNVNIDENCLLVTFDIVNLYLSTLTRDTVDILVPRHTNAIEIYNILSIVKHLTSNNYANFKQSRR